MTNQAKIRVGVLGATGYIGQPYRSEMREVDDVQIVALHARRRDRLEAAQREDGASLITDNWREVVEHPEVNFVVIATPDSLHHEAVMACAAANKHILCEKPVGKSVVEAAEMCEVYQQAGTLANFVPFWTRYAPAFARAKEIVCSGRLGDIRGVVYRWHNPRPANMPLTWRDDANVSAGGSIADVGSHAYDAVCWLIGGEAVRVLAHAENITPAKADLGEINLDEALRWGAAPNDPAPTTRKATTPDYASIAWQFSSGAVGTLVVSHATYFRKGLCPELELHGTKASLAINRVTGDLHLARPDEAPELLEKIPEQGSCNRFAKFVFPVVRRIMGGAEPPDHPDLESGLSVQRFTDAALQSAASGSWVDINPRAL